MSFARPLIAALALFATSCGEGPAPQEATAPEPGQQAASSVPEAPLLPFDTLAGSYRVAGIDGREIAGSMGIALTIDDQSLSYEPHCLGFVWLAEPGKTGTFTLARHPDFATQTAPDGSTVTCQPDVTPAFHELAAALDAIDRAVRTPSNGIELSGGGRSVLLFTQ